MQRDITFSDWLSCTWNPSTKYYSLMENPKSRVEEKCFTKILGWVWRSKVRQDQFFFFFLITRMFTLIPQVSTSVKLFSDSYFSRRQVYCIFSSSASLSLWTQGHFRWALWYINRHATIFISCFIGMLEGLHSTYFSFLIRFVSWGLEELSDLSYSMAMESPCF